MGVDIGTFETKGLLLDGEFNIVTVATAQHGMENPQPNHYEHDADEVWWKDFCTVSRALLAQSGIDAAQVVCVAASALGCDCLPVDEDCNPLRKAILYGIDARAQAEIDFLNKHYGPQGVQERFGRPMCSDDVAAKILWIKNNEPDVYAKTHKFLTGSSFLAAKLTGAFVVDQFLAKAAFRPCYREDGSIDEAECALFCKPEQLAECKNVTDIAGTVTAKAAAETSLKEGTPVITGTGDSTAEAISTGVVGAGDLMVQFGSSLFFYYCADRPVEDHRLHAGNFTIPGMYSFSAGTNAAGTLTRWFRDNLFFDCLQAEHAGGPNAFEAMLEGLDEIPPGSEKLVMLPYLAGERTPINDPLAKGMLFGLNLGHTRKHLYRAALESVAYSIGQHVDIIRELGLPIRNIMAVGGGAKNPLWMQIVADVIGQELQICEVTIGASYGDALMAAIGAGYLSGFEALHDVIRVDRVIRPDAARHAQYQPFRELFDRLYENNKDLMHAL